MYDCSLLKKGIVVVQFEGGDSSPECCAYDEEVTTIRLRQRNTLAAYGSTDLVIVDRRHNDGHGALPFIVVRKGP